LTQGDYQDLAPDHPQLWCYRRSWQDQTLTVIANLSNQVQTLNMAFSAREPLYSNYIGAPVANRLRPYECAYWLEENRIN
ncbi:DUF3459 domain-containing protein, partial [Salmonella sp. hn-f5]|nr:DUF3459 domain-containing protein [Salmonella sp. hn-f5]